MTEIKKEVGTSAGMYGSDVQGGAKIVVPTPDLPRIEGIEGIETEDDIHNKKERKVEDGNIPNPKKKGNIRLGYWISKVYNLKKGR